MDDHIVHLSTTYSVIHSFITCFRYRTGPNLIQTTAPRDVTHLVLVINGRENSKIKYAKAWLDYLPHYPSLKGTVVVMLGDEGCNNDWLQPYMRNYGGLVDLLFVVYDSVRVDDRGVFQWPLGVAT